MELSIAAMALLFEIASLDIQIPATLTEAGIYSFSRNRRIIIELAELDLVDIDDDGLIRLTFTGQTYLDSRPLELAHESTRFVIDGLAFEVATPGWADGDAQLIHALVLKELLLIARRNPPKLRAMHLHSTGATPHPATAHIIAGSIMDVLDRYGAGTRSGDPSVAITAVPLGDT